MKSMLKTLQSITNITRSSAVAVIADRTEAVRSAETTIDYTV